MRVTTGGYDLTDCPVSRVIGQELLSRTAFFGLFGGAPGLRALVELGLLHSFGRRMASLLALKEAAVATLRRR